MSIRKFYNIQNFDRVYKGTPQDLNTRLIFHSQIISKKLFFRLEEASIMNERNFSDLAENSIKFFTESLIFEYLDTIKVFYFSIFYILLYEMYSCQKISI